ncbi:MAG: DUF362 domain-containing protein [bacterium]
MAKSKVAVLKTSPETVIQDYKRLFKLAGLKETIEKRKTTILKSNISWHYMYPGANTTPWQLEAVIQYLTEEGYQDVVAVENDTVVTNALKGERLNKLDKVFQKYKIPVKYSFKDADINWQPYYPRARMRVLERLFPDGIPLPFFFFGKNIIHLPTVKCHIYTQTTGAMKNAFGGLLNKNRHYTHTYIHETLVDLLKIQREIHAGIFAVMDGTTAGDGPGPRTMHPREKDIIIASKDQVAIDAFAASLMGFNPMDINYIRFATEAGLGNGQLSDVEIVGDDVGGQNWNFTTGNNFAGLIGRFLWFGPLKRLQPLFFQTPLVYFFVFSSFLYHDFVWYPFKGRTRVKNFLKNSKWGKLFKSY